MRKFAVNVESLIIQWYKQHEDILEKMCSMKQLDKHPQLYREDTPRGKEVLGEKNTELVKGYKNRNFIF